jgi:hypothetical protein
MNVFSRPLRSSNGILKHCAQSRSFYWPSRFARQPSSSSQKWSHPPSSTTVADDEVSTLASQPLHTLSLEDLVKCDTTYPEPFVGDLLTHPQTRAPSSLDRSLIRLCKLHPVPPPNPSGAPSRKSPESAFHCGVQS